MRAINKILRILILSFVVAVCGFFATANIPVAKAEETESEISLSIEAKNVSYSESVYIMYAVSFENANYQNIKMLFWDETQEDYTLGTEKYQATYSSRTTVNGKKCVVFYSNGLAAKNMTDDIYARAYVEVDGQNYYSPIEKYSVLEYAYQMFEKDSDKDKGNDLSNEQRNLFTALLNYGAAAQEMFGYKTERLANDTYYKIEVENGKLADGFTYGRYTQGQTITITANEPIEGYEFLHWLDNKLNVVSEESTFEVTVAEENAKYYAVYKSTTSDDTIGDEIKKQSQWKDKENMFPFPLEWMDLDTVASTYGLKMMNRSVALFSSGDETQTESEIELSVQAKNVSYSESVYIMYAVSFGSAPYQNVKMLFWKGVQEDYVIGTETYQASYSSRTTVNGKKCVVFYSNGLAAKNMTDDIYARAYVEVDGVKYYSPVEKFSVLEYVYQMFEKDTDDDANNDLSDLQRNLFSSLLNYGAAAQELFGYNTDKLANDTYYKIEVENGKLADGFTSGRYIAGETVIITANEPIEGKKFSHWQDSEGNVAYTTATAEVMMPEGATTYTAIYVDDIVVGDIVLPSETITYNGNLEQILPSTVAFDCAIGNIELAVDWQVQNFNAQQVGEQTIYATLVDSSAYLTYGIEDIYMEINVVPYSLELDGATGKYILTGYYGNETDVVLPSTYEDIEIFAIGENAFTSCSSLTSVEIPYSVTNISANAFANCDLLQSIIVNDLNGTYQSEGGILYSEDLQTLIKYPMGKDQTTLAILSSVTTIGQGAFDNSSLEYIVISSVITTIGDDAFANCDDLIIYCTASSKPSGWADNWNSSNCQVFWGYVEGTEGLEYALINNDTEYAVTSYAGSSTDVVIPKVYLGKNVTKIGDALFSGQAITSIEIPATIKVIGSSAFNKCDSLTKVNFLGTIDEWVEIDFVDAAASPTRMSKSLYINGELVTDVKLTTATKINPRSFYYCESITSLELSDTVKSIGEYAFRGCKALTSVIMSDSVETIGVYAFENCTLLESVVLPNGIERLESHLFAGCTALASVNIPSTVTYMGDLVFYKNPNLKTLYIPASVETMITVNTSGSTVGTIRECSSLTIYCAVDSAPSGWGSRWNYSSRPIKWGYQALINQAITAIDAIGTITLADADIENRITTARTTYNSIDFDYAKGLVTNYNDLVLAEQTFEQMLVDANEWKVAVEAVVIDEKMTATNIADINQVEAIYKGWLESQDEYYYQLATGIAACGDKYGYYYYENLIQERENFVAEISGLANDMSAISVNVDQINLDPNAFNNQVLSARNRYDSLSITITAEYFTKASAIYKSAYDNYTQALGYYNNVYRLIGDIINLGDPTEVNLGQYNVIYEYINEYNNLSDTYKAIVDNGGYKEILDVAKETVDELKKLNLIEYTLINNDTEYAVTRFSGTAQSVYIPSEYLGLPVTRIDEYAFIDCTALKSVVVSNSVTTIGYGAFKGCTVLESLTLPFVGQNSTELKNAYIGYIFGVERPTEQNPTHKTGVPQTLKEIIITGNTKLGYGALAYCQGLEKIEIAEGVTEAGYGAFAYNDKLTQVNLPNSLATYDFGAFAYCTALVDIELPYGTQIIGEAMFIECSSLSSVVMPNTVVTIEDYAFAYCTSLQTILVPNSVETIDYGAFAYCSALSEIEIGRSVSLIGEYAFIDCESLEKVYFLGTIDNWAEIEFVDYSANPLSYGGDLYINNKLVTTINLTSATKVSNYAFATYNKLTSVTISSNIESIGVSAFSNCNFLTGITIPNTTKSIGDYAFYNCTALSSVTLSTTLETIGELAFYKCDSLSSVRISSTVTTIGYHAFQYCYALTIYCEGLSAPVDWNYNWKMPTTPIVWNCNNNDIANDEGVYVSVNGVKYLIKNGEASVARQASNLTEVTIPSTISYNGRSYTVTSVGDRAFYNCTLLTKVTLPNTLRSLGSRAFYYCTTLKSTAIPDSVTSIGSYAFAGCSSLENISIPDNLTSMGINAFAGCSCISYNTSGGLNYLGSINNPYLYLVGPINNDVAEVSINSNCKIIGPYAFTDCNVITSIKIPSNIKYIDSSAFYNCRALTIYCEPSSKPSTWKSDWNYMENPVVWNCNNNNTTSDGYVYAIIDGIRYALKGNEAIVAKQSWSIVTAEIPSSITYNSSSYEVVMIEKQAFASCSLLTTVIIPNSIVAIGDKAFDDCRALNYNIDEDSPDLRYLGSGDNPYLYLASVRDKEIVSININSDCKIIGSHVFYNCINITTVTIPSSVISVGAYAFAKCSNLTKVIIPNSVKQIGDDVFYDCPSLTYNISGGLKYLGNSSNRYLYLAIVSDKTITTATIKTGCKFIGSSSFNGCELLTDITIPNSITCIGSAAFEACGSLTSIIIPSSVTTMGNHMFDNCDGLTIKCELQSQPINWDSNWNYSNNPVIWDCNNNTSTEDGTVYVMSNGVRYSIKDGKVVVAKQLNAVKEINIQSSIVYNGTTYPVNSIGEQAFTGCYLLEKVYIPNSITTIDSTALYNRQAVTIYCEASSKPSTWSSDWNYMDNPVVWNYKNNNVADDGYIYLIVDGVRYAIKDGEACITKQLNSIKVANIASSITYNGVAYNVTSIIDYAFEYCTSLVTLTIPNSVTYIGCYAFYYCYSVVSITIPASVLWIGNYAFFGCDGVTEIVFEDYVNWRKTEKYDIWITRNVGAGITVADFYKNVENLCSTYYKYYLFKKK